MNQADLIFNGTEAVFREGLISVENGICKRKPNIFKVCIPDSVLVIEDNAFYQCLNLKEVIFSSNLAEIGSQCFCYTKIKSLEFPDSLKVIGNSAFNSCKLLQEINMTDSVMDIGAGAFANCIALEKVVLSSSLTEISKQLFAACPSLNSVEIPNGIKSIGDGAFQASGLCSIKIPPSVTTIGSMAFAYCENLQEVKVYRDTQIADDAFEGSQSVKIKKYETTELMNQTPMEELNILIGLGNVKKEIEKLRNFVIIQQKRKEMGEWTIRPSYHCVFTGNPGTGKTTVARIVGGIYRDLGILTKGHLIETDRSGLVADRPGQTAAKTNAVIDSALDGILFIDEAYALVEGSDDFGIEAINTLLKRMEDDRDRLIVIMAGYTNNMKKLIESNPGLQSRFTRYIEFDDYDSIELENIFLCYANKFKYHLTDFAKDYLRLKLEYAVEHKDKNFGNGRFVRNMFEKVVQNQSERLSGLEILNDDTIKTITHHDFFTYKESKI